MGSEQATVARTVNAPNAPIAVLDHTLRIEQLKLMRRRTTRQQQALVAVLCVLTIALFVLNLMMGNTFYGLGDVIRVLRGVEVEGASFTVGELRLPRATGAMLAGLSLGAAGTTFQSLLRNDLASPDVIGISFGASAAAVAGIVLFSMSQLQLSLLALIGGLTTAATLQLIASRGGFSGSRFILVGVGFAAMLQSVVTYLLSRASDWEMQTAMRWLTGSTNGLTWQQVAPLALTTAGSLAVMVLSGRAIDAIRLGDASATSLGVSVTLARAAMLIAAVISLAGATAATGPIAFVAFMAGPVTSRLIGIGNRLVVPSALVGAILVLGADLAGQNAFTHRYPVGVITGAIGAPFLVVLLVRANRTGSAL
jgi:iron complex transport system permease protein